MQQKLDMVNHVSQTFHYHYKTLFMLIRFFLHFVQLNYCIRRRREVEAARNKSTTSTSTTTRIASAIEAAHNDDTNARKDNDGGAEWDNFDIDLPDDVDDEANDDDVKRDATTTALSENDGFDAALGRARRLPIVRTNIGILY